MQRRGDRERRSVLRPVLKKSLRLCINARLLPANCDSEPLGKLVDDEAILVRDMVVYVGELRKVPGVMRLLQKGTKGFVCEAKDDKFRVRFNTLFSGSVHCGADELKTVYAFMKHDAPGASAPSTSTSEPSRREADTTRM